MYRQYKRLKNKQKEHRTAIIELNTNNTLFIREFTKRKRVQRRQNDRIKQLEHQQQQLYQLININAEQIDTNTSRINSHEEDIDKVDSMANKRKRNVNEAIVDLAHIGLVYVHKKDFKLHKIFANSAFQQFLNPPVRTQANYEVFQLKHGIIIEDITYHHPLVRPSGWESLRLVKAWARDKARYNLASISYNSDNGKWASSVNCAPCWPSTVRHRNKDRPLIKILILMHRQSQ